MDYRTSPPLHLQHFPAHSAQSTLDHLATLANARTRGRYLRIPCPAHGGTNPNLALWVNGDGIGAKCHSAGCSYAEITAAIMDRFGISIGQRSREHWSQPLAPNVTTTPPAASNTQDLRSYALQLWHQSTPIPSSPHHPARKWLAVRQLWRPDLPLPSGVRWTDAKHLHKDFQGAGAVIAMAAQPAAWTRAWPRLPEISCMQLIFVAQDGGPAVDRGLTKRTYAGTRDAVVILGCPLLDEATGPVDVAEGLADALALASRSPAPAVATLGTSGMTSQVVARWLANSPATRVWADRDDAKEGRAPPGQRYGRELVRLVEAVGGNAQAVHAQTPHKDPAAAAAALGFNDPDPAWIDYARTLAEVQPDWPRWEVARQATSICARGG